MPEEKPDITDALNWLASHSGEYSVVILEHIEQLTTKVDGFNSWLNRLDKLCNEPYVEMPTGMTREERHSWAKQAQQNVSMTNK